MATPNMNLVLPIPNVTSGTWGDILNTAFSNIDAHDHSSGSGATTVRPTLVDVQALGDNTAITLNGGDGGTTQGAFIKWTHPVEGRVAYLTSPNGSGIYSVNDSGTFGIQQTPAMAATGAIAKAVFDTDAHLDPWQAAAHVILTTQFHKTRVSDNGQLDTDSSFRFFPGWPGSFVSNPALTLSLTDATFEVPITLRSPNNSLWRVTVDNAGNLIVSATV